MSPDDIKKDKAICEAATQGEWWREDVFVLCFDGKSPLEGRGHHQEILNAAAAVNAVNRLPAYIVEAESMARRLVDVEAAAEKAEAAARRHTAMSEAAGAEREAARASALRWALKVIRGEQ